VRFCEGSEVPFMDCYAKTILDLPERGLSAVASEP